MSKIKATIIKSDIQKALTPTEIQDASYALDNNFIAPSADLRGLKTLVDNSFILPQCIRAYKNNIAGFGIGVKYKEDIKETPEMKKEFEKLQQIIECLSLDADTKEIFEDVIEARETYGIAYLEVVRDKAGDVAGIEFINQTPTIQKTLPLDPLIEIEYSHNGTVLKCPKKFCKYRQQLNGQTVYFKEMSDPRIMDLRTGEYGENIPIECQANELLEFTNGTAPYGEVRWLGQVLGVDGARRAEILNNAYFSHGRHTPLLLIANRTVSDETFNRLQQYMQGIEGEAGQHSFLFLDVDSGESRVDMGGDDKGIDIQVHKMADILQHDELFQGYLENTRKRVQSAFQLPDLYVGYTSDFNRATAQSAQELTEQQIFQPERKSLAWIINHKLLSGYSFKYVEVEFLSPEVKNPDDLVKILSLAERAGALTPNKAKEIAFNALGEISENFNSDWGEIPLTVAKLNQQKPQDMVRKAYGNDELIAVMKEVRNLLDKKTL